MQLWNDFLTWFNSPDGTSVLVNGVVPFLAIVVAGLVAAAIGRGSTKRLIALNDRDNRVSAIATMIGAARKASVWNTLSIPEQQHAEHVASEADVRVRLLGVTGSGLAADWAAHEFASMKRNSVSFSFQAEQSLIEFRDRMVTWQSKPGRARKLFKNDLDVWAYEDSQTANTVVTQQQEWAKAQVATQVDPAPAVAFSAVHTAAAPTEAPIPAAVPVAAAPVAPVVPASPAAPPAAEPTPASGDATAAEFVPTPAFGLGRRTPSPTTNDDLATQAAPVIAHGATASAPPRLVPSTPSWISPTPQQAASDDRRNPDASAQLTGAEHGDQPSLVEPIRRSPLPVPRVETVSESSTPSFLDTVDAEENPTDKSDGDRHHSADFSAPIAANGVKNRTSPSETDDEGRAY